MGRAADPTPAWDVASSTMIVHRHRGSGEKSVARRPAAVGTEIDGLVATAYLRLAESDATGGDTDNYRYRSPFPSGGISMSSTMRATK